jgi:hypothetical protein
MGSLRPLSPFHMDVVEPPSLRADSSLVRELALVRAALEPPAASFSGDITAFDL